MKTLTFFSGVILKYYLLDYQRKLKGNGTEETFLI